MRRNPALVALVVVACVVSTAAPSARAGQDPPPVPPAPETPAKEPAPAPKPAPKAEPKSEPKQDETPVTGTLYAVRLKSGRAVRGVVHSSGPWERKGSDGWAGAQREDVGAGLRLWYPNHLDGFLFVVAKDIHQIEDLGALSAEEGKKIARERTDAAARADGERARIKAEAEERAAKEAAAAAARAEVETARREAAAAGGTKTAPDAVAGAMVPLDSAKRFAELLEKFPPTVWQPDTPKEIERRRITLDLFPTDEEKDFLSVYAEWREAYEFWKKGAESKGASSANAK